MSSDSGVPTTFLLTSFYWDNLIRFGMGPKPAGDGTSADDHHRADARLLRVLAQTEAREVDLAAVHESSSATRSASQSDHTYSSVIRCASRYDRQLPSSTDVAARALRTTALPPRRRATRAGAPA
jgi:hypothetical protein